MSAQTCRDRRHADRQRRSARTPDKAPRALRVSPWRPSGLGVAALAAATFVLSYSAIRAVALQAGIAPRLARGYPLLLDAMLVIVLAAVLALRGAGLPSRLLAWLTLLVVLAAAAGADALHAAGRTAAAPAPPRLPRPSCRGSWCSSPSCCCSPCSGTPGCGEPAAGRPGDASGSPPAGGPGTPCLPARRQPRRRCRTWPAAGSAGQIQARRHELLAVASRRSPTARPTEPELEAPEPESTPRAEARSSKSRACSRCRPKPAGLAARAPAAGLTSPDMPVFHRMWSVRRRRQPRRRGLISRASRARSRVSAVAMAAMPSPRPVRPRPSEVVAARG